MPHRRPRAVVIVAGAASPVSARRRGGEAPRGRDGDRHPRAAPPHPSSVTTTRTRSSCRLTDTDALDAPACLATLVKALVTTNRRSIRPSATVVGAAAPTTLRWPGNRPERATVDRALRPESVGVRTPTAARRGRLLAGERRLTLLRSALYGPNPRYTALQGREPAREGGVRHGTVKKWPGRRQSGLGIR
jgi:hypothetical protein